MRTTRLNYSDYYPSMLIPCRRIFDKSSSLCAIKISQERSELARVTIIYFKHGVQIDKNQTLTFVSPMADPAEGYTSFVHQIHRFQYYYTNYIYTSYAGYKGFLQQYGVSTVNLY